ncbi:hypothetical protein WJX75_000396 [Coccomyxa subellipsoidea]|uniref:Protein kinase domain-containing protein n=1 Tax=Coccomyxa subellipsoidea TaxID=248742 RepID=A0ABR2YZH3_9CHLO
MRLLGSFCVFLLLAFEPRLAHGQSLHGPVEVNTSAALAASLASPHTTSILLSGNIRLKRSQWNEGATVLAPGRRLSLRPAGTELVVLDMANIVDAIHVSKDAVLELHNITVTNTAPIVGASISDHTRYVVPFLPLWPSVTFEPGATIVAEATLQYTWSNLLGEGCDDFRADVNNSLRPYGLQPFLAFPSQHLEMALLHGSHLYQQPILDIRTNSSAGYLMLNETNTKSLCIPYPVDGLDSEAGNDSADGIVLPLRAASMMGPATSQGSSSGQERSDAGPLALNSRFIALIVALVMATALSLILAGFLIVQRHRCKLRQVQDQKEEEETALDNNGPVVPRSPFEDMKVSLIDGARAKSDSRLFTTGRGDESQSKELLMTWDNVEDNRRSLLAAPGHHRRWGSVDSEASITIQLSSVPSQRSSVDHSLASSPLRRAQSLTVADPPFAVSGRLGSFFPSARSVDSGASEYTLPSLPSLPSLPPTPSRSPASRAYRGAPSMPAAAAAAAAAVLGPAGGPASQAKAADPSPRRTSANALIGPHGSSSRPGPSPFSMPKAMRKRSNRTSIEFAGLRIGKLIGTGSFGRVYKGLWRESTVAIKAIMHNATLSRKVDTLRESLVGISIQHPNVMTTYKVLTTIEANALVHDAPQRRADAMRANGYSVAQLGPGSAQTPAEEELLETWLLLEYCDGGPLDRAIANKRFTNNMAAIYLSLMDITAGMIYLHSLGVVHSDLKGANVLLKSAPRTAADARGFVCKIADFGLSRVLGANRTHVSTNSHGTVSHQAMEVLHDGRIARSSDVYSFAMIMLEMITGVPVYEGFSSSQILYQVFNGARPHMPDGLPAGYKQLIEDCWHSEHNARPTFVAVHERLRSLFQKHCGISPAHS